METPEKQTLAAGALLRELGQTRLRPEQSLPFVSRDIVCLDMSAAQALERSLVLQGMHFE